jgi:hypothetical protein
VSVSSSTRCETDAETGELKCETLERVWKRYADGSSLTEETRRPAGAGPLAAAAGPLASVVADGLGQLLGGVLSAGLGTSVSSQLERKRPADQRPPAGGQWA